MIADKYERFRADANFIKRYMDAANPATGSDYDPNSNVASKSCATLAAETGKRAKIYTNRLMMYDKLTELYDEATAESYIADLESHRVYRHDETGQIPTPYCASITLYPFLLHGIKGLGGTTDAPKHLSSFAGGFINLVFAASAQVLGAVATPEFLPYLNYFICKEYGDDYYNHLDKVVDGSSRQRTIDQVITDVFCQIVYSINQPAAARGNQAVFWNVAYFDKPYYHSLFEDFVFPDGTSMEELWPSYWFLQKRFMTWFNKERTRKPLTFPVETFSLLNDGTDCVDKEAKDWVAYMYSQGHSFFTYTSDSVDSLASCCRLKNGIQDTTFSYSLGAGGVATGSKCVMSININRLVQDAVKSHTPIRKAVTEQVDLVHKYLTAFNAMVKEAESKHMLPLYDAGFVKPEKQYLTVGVNGVVESAEFLGIKISDNEDYRRHINNILEPIYELNKAHRTEEIMFNTEFVPGESLGVKNAAWDKAAGYAVPRPCYNSYFYVVEDEETSPLDKFTLHGRNYTSKLDGGSALHCNLKEHLTKSQYEHLLRVAINEGCNYFTFNIPNTICNDCGHIDKRFMKTCSKCESKNVDWLTRVIGYLVRVKNMSSDRQKEAEKRYYA